MSILEKIASILDTIEGMNEKLDRLLASKVEKDWSLLEGASDTTTDIPEVRETKLHSPGFEDYKPPEEGISLDVEYEGRQYRGKWSICKYKCGALTSWPADYKKGDQKLHVHPTDKEILGFAMEDMNGDLKCPMVVKK